MAVDGDDDDALSALLSESPMLSRNVFPSNYSSSFSPSYFLFIGSGEGLAAFGLPVFWLGGCPGLFLLPSPFFFIGGWLLVMARLFVVIRHLVYIFVYFVDTFCILLCIFLLYIFVFCYFTLFIDQLDLYIDYTD